MNVLAYAEDYFNDCSYDHVFVEDDNYELMFEARYGESISEDEDHDLLHDQKHTKEFIDKLMIEDLYGKLISEDHDVLHHQGMV
ncbi:hypothetical protein ON010_g16448 [Phytophthora cinnamomi]|nr:hypothetical protein ON010_g16448 [Phytophthora cinnamomi]